MTKGIYVYIEKFTAPGVIRLQRGFHARERERERGG